MNIGCKSLSFSINPSNNSLGMKFRMKHFENIHDFKNFYNNLRASVYNLKAVPLKIGTLRISKLIKGKNIWVYPEKNSRSHKMFFDLKYFFAKENSLKVQENLPNKNQFVFTLMKQAEKTRTHVVKFKRSSLIKYFLYNIIIFLMNLFELSKEI